MLPRRARCLPAYAMRLFAFGQTATAFSCCVTRARRGGGGRWTNILYQINIHNVMVVVIVEGEDIGLDVVVEKEK